MSQSSLHEVATRAMFLKPSKAAENTQACVHADALELSMLVKLHRLRGEELHNVRRTDPQSEQHFLCKTKHRCHVGCFCCSCIHAVLAGHHEQLESSRRGILNLVTTQHCAYSEAATNLP